MKLLPESTEAKELFEKSKKLNDSLNSKETPSMTTQKKLEIKKETKFDFLTKSNPLPNVSTSKIKPLVESTPEEVQPATAEVKEPKKNIVEVPLTKMETKFPKTCPQNFYEFEQYFREFKGTSKFSQYLKVTKKFFKRKLIEPKKYSTLFGSSFTVDHLNEILDSVLNVYLKFDKLIKLTLTETPPRNQTCFPLKL
jgi:hypothetical protein